MKPEYMTRKQAAQKLGISPQWISVLVRRGKLTSIQLSDAPNAHKHISTASIEKLLESK
jgi:hypothetical protein